MKRLKIRDSQGIETVDKLLAPSPFMIEYDRSTAFYDPSRQALVRLAPSFDASFSSPGREIVGKGRFVLSFHYLLDGPSKGDLDLSHYERSLRDLLTGEDFALSPSLPVGENFSSVFSQDMEYVYSRKVWADDPLNPAVNAAERSRLSVSYWDWLKIASRDDVHLGLYRTNTRTGETEELLRMDGASVPLSPALTVNPQGTIALMHGLDPTTEGRPERLLQIDTSTGEIIRSLPDYEIGFTTSWNAEGNRCIFPYNKEDAIRILNFDTGKRLTYRLNRGKDWPGSGRQDGAMFTHGIAPDGRIYVSGEKGNTLIIKLIDMYSGDEEELFRVTSEHIKYARFAQFTKDFYLQPAT